MARACDEVEAFAVGAGWGPTDVSRIVLAAGEALGNAVEHGRGPDLRVRFESTRARIDLRISDDGPGPSARRIAAAALPADPLATGGRGLYIVRQLAESVAVDGGGRVCLSFEPRS